MLQLRLSIRSRGPVRSQSVRLVCEWLEDRTVPTTLFVDFGDRFNGGVLNTTQGGLRDVANYSGANNPVLGPELDDASGSFNSSTPLEIIQQTFSVTDREEMMAIVRRAYLPLNINVVELTATPQVTSDGRVVEGAASMSDVVNTLRQGSVNSKDSYVFVAGYLVDPGGANETYYGSNGGGTSPDANGFGEQSDLATGMNLHDDVATVFSFGGFDINFANNIAHEAGHTFGLQHSITQDDSDPNVNQYHDAEIMSYENTNTTTSSMFSRMPEVRGDDNTPGGYVVNYNDLEARDGTKTAYDQLMQDPHVGANPNYTFVSGTGLNDTITIAKSGANALVSVSAYTTTTHTAGTAVIIPGQTTTVYSYTIPLTKTILIYSGDGDDQITVDGDLGVNVQIDGMNGTDSLIVDGQNAASAVYTPGNATADSVDLDLSGFDPAPMTSYSGALTFGGTTIRFDDYETDSLITLRNVAAVTYRTSGGSDDIALKSLASHDTLITGSVNGGTAVVPLEVIQDSSLAVDLGSGDTTANTNTLTVSIDSQNPLLGQSVSYAGGVGTDSIAISGDADYTLSDSEIVYNDLSQPRQGPLAIGLSSVEQATLTGGVSANTFTVLDWSGSASLFGLGGTDTLQVEKDADFNLSNSSLSTSDGMDLSLQSIEIANLTGGASDNTFTVSGWTGKGSLVGLGGANAIAATKASNFTLTDSTLQTSDGMALTLSGITTAMLAGGGNSNSFDVSGWTGTGSIDGSGATDSITATLDGNFILADNALLASDGLSLALASIEVANLTGGASSNSFTVGGWTGAGTINGGGGADLLTATRDADFTLTATGLSDSKGLNLNIVSIETTVLTGGVGANTFTLNGATGTVEISGGGGQDAMDALGGAGDESANLWIDDATGGGTLMGLGANVGFAGIANLKLDGQGGTNSLAWIDATGGAWGNANAPETGVIFRPTGVASGDVRVGVGGNFPTLSFTNFGGAFTLDGDGNSTGRRDMLTVLGTSSTGLQSVGLWGEATAANGADTINVSDAGVSITNATLGLLRSVTLDASGGTPTFGTLLVRGGNEAAGSGDTVIAVPSTRIDILVDGMGPTGTGIGDTIKVPIVGQRTFEHVGLSDLGPDESRVGQSDGASVGFYNFERAPGPLGYVVTGSGAGSIAEVRVTDSITGALVFAPIHPFDGFLGGVSVATGDVNGDGTADIIVGAGAGSGSRIVVYDGVTGAMIRSFFAFGPEFIGGVTVAAGDVDGDGYADIVVGAGPGAGPHVKVFSGRTGSQLLSFYAFNSGFQGGVSVAAGDLNSDGLAEIVVGMGSGGTPEVATFSGSTGAQIGHFYAYDIRFTGGVNVAVGDINGDGTEDIVTGAGIGGAPHVKAFRGTDFTQIASFYAYDPSFTGGVSVATGDLDGDGTDEIFTGAGTGAGPHFKAFRTVKGLLVESTYAGDPTAQSGLHV